MRPPSPDRRPDHTHPSAPTDASAAGPQALARAPSLADTDVAQDLAQTTDITRANGPREPASTAASRSRAARGPR